MALLVVTPRIPVLSLSFALSSQASQAEPAVPRAGRGGGLFHIMPLAIGSTVPHQLSSLEYKLLVVEVHDKVCSANHLQ
jgi:hypothetical protein